MGNPHHHGAKNSEAAQSANQAMSEDHMDMGPHMKMTTLRRQRPGDQERADKIVEEARQAEAAAPLP